MWRHIASNAVSFLLVGLFLGGGVILWGKSEYAADGPLSQAICLQVERGSNMRRVSEELAARGAVSSASIFRIGANYADKTNQLKAGSFLVTPGSTMEEIIDTITKGGASTCGTEVVYRIGVNRISVQVRELDPATNRFVERAQFIPATEDAPEIYTEMKEKGDTRFRIALAEGTTSWQVNEALKGIEVLQVLLQLYLPRGRWPLTAMKCVRVMIAQAYWRVWKAHNRAWWRKPGPRGIRTYPLIIRRIC